MTCRAERLSSSIGAAGVVLVLTAAPASANIYVPSLVQMLTAPLAYSLLAFTMLITVPVILGISLIEAAAIRRYVKRRGLWSLACSLAVINAITSLLGLPLMPSGTELWPGLAIAFALTVPLEALMLLAVRDVARGLPFRRAFLLSLRMNTASYAALAIVLTGLVYVPVIGNEDTSILPRLHGRIVLRRFSTSLRELDLERHPPVLSRENDIAMDERDYLEQWFATSSNQVTGITRKGTVVRIERRRSGWRVRREGTRAVPGNCKGVSPNGRYACCIESGKPVLYDLRTHRVVARIPLTPADEASAVISTDGRFVVMEDALDMGSGASHNTAHSETRVFDVSTGERRGLGKVWSAVISPTAPILAWADDRGLVTMDLARNRRRRIPIKGSLGWREIAWSPDGRHIAYVGNPNPFTAQHWTPDVRVVDVRTGRSVTVWRRLFTSGAPSGMVWTAR